MTKGILIGVLVLVALGFCTKALTIAIVKVGFMVSLGTVAIVLGLIGYVVVSAWKKDKKEKEKAKE